MAEPEQGGAAAFIRDAPLPVVLEIINRLPAISVLRLRAVCKEWGVVASHPAVLYVLHRLQRPLPLICFNRTACPDRYVPLTDYCVEGINLRSRELRSIFRFTDSEYRNFQKFAPADEVAPINDFPVNYDYYEDDDDEKRFMRRLTIHASLDGLLLVSYVNAYYVLNPATRQWATLPDLRSFDVVGFYKHVSTGEYRVLYVSGKDNADADTCYYVSAVNSLMGRGIGCPISPSAVEDMGLDIGLEPAKLSPPVQLECSLHWPPQERQGYHILVFDTEVEFFSWISPPVKDKDMRLLEIDGMLAMSVSRMNKKTVELWRLEDHRNEIWVLAFQIQLQVADMIELYYQDWSSSIVSREGDVLIECPHWVLVCDRNGNLLQKFWFPDEAVSCRHSLRESLLRHAMFRKRKWLMAVEPPFYRGL